MEKINKVFVYMALLALFIYPLSIYGSILVVATALILSITLVKDKGQTSKVLQPTILLVSLVVVRSVFALILAIIQKFASVAENYRVVTNISNTINVIDALLLIVLIAFISIATVFIVMNKDIPFVEWVANKILGIETQKPAKQRKESDPVVTVKREPKKQTSSVKKTKRGTIIIDATKKNDEE